MQRAARKVAQENERLRTLLARHGILNEEINAFLRSSEQAEGSATPETSTSSVRSLNVTNPYPVHAGPRSLSIQPLNQAYSRDYSPRPSPMSSRPPVQIARQPDSASAATTTRWPVTQGGPINKTSTEMQTEATVMVMPVKDGGKFEAYYASPSETGSSPPSLPREVIPAFTFLERTPTITQSQGYRPPPKPQQEIIMEDQDCPSTADCFCPPTATAPSATNGPVIRTDEMSCETAATIIAQMRGDGDEAAARVSLGCAPQQICSIKNAFLMQVLDER